MFTSLMALGMFPKVLQNCRLTKMGEETECCPETKQKTQVSKCKELHFHSHTASSKGGGSVPDKLKRQATARPWFFLSMSIVYLGHCGSDIPDKIRKIQSKSKYPFIYHVVKGMYKKYLKKKYCTFKLQRGETQRILLCAAPKQNSPPN